MDLIAFARGVPAPEMLPVDDLRAAATRAFDHHTTKVLSYGTGAGWDPLRERLAERQGVDSQRIVVTSGSLQGFALLAEAIATQAHRENRRARVIVERPTYDRPLLLLERLGIEIVPVPLDEGGVDVTALDAAMADGADLAYLIPTYQNPAGATLTDERRDAVVAAAARHGVLVLEDDPYGLLHFDEPAPATLFERRGDAPIAFSGSFSKTVAPGLRVGWLVLPTELAATVATLANDTYISSSFLGQATVDEYLAAGAFEPNVDRARALLHERRDIVVDALGRHLPDASFVTPQGGYFIWVKLPDGIEGSAVARIAGEHGISLVAGGSFGAGCDDHVRLAFSSPSKDQLDEGISRLAAACDAALAIA
ncbi:MAG: PLP-dependent aminotransferase family protein [Thermoleophilia bacterium]|nr:PLP-dependent aminotransferase family protein [Thermoleophilia bacterium]